MRSVVCASIKGISRAFAGHLVQYGPRAEGVRVEQYPRVPLAAAGVGGEGVGLAVGGGDLQGLSGHDFSCRG
jgi:hypothetical protein